MSDDGGQPAWEQLALDELVTAEQSPGTPAAAAGRRRHAARKPKLRWEQLTLDDDRSTT